MGRHPLNGRKRGSLPGGRTGDPPDWDAETRWIAVNRHGRAILNDMARRRQRSREEECPHCGETFRAGKAACPHCGSDADTGWADADEIEYQSVEIPDFYEDPAATPPWRWVSIVLIVGTVLALLAVLRMLTW